MSTPDDQPAAAAVTIVRLRGSTDELRDRARTTFVLMTNVFEEPGEPLGDAYLDLLLARPDFWAFAAVIDGHVVGGITGHALMMTRRESRELFIYDLAVSPAHQRRGIGRRLIGALTSAALEAGIRVAFVPVDNDDADALDFYRVVGGIPAACTIFTFD